MRVAVVAMLGSALAFGAGCTCGGPVRTVSDRGGAPVAGVQVQIDDGPWVTTDGQGWAGLPSVAPPFVLRVHQVISGSSSNGSFQNDDIWQFLIQEEGPVVVLVSGSALPKSAASIAGSVSGSSGGTVVVFFSGETTYDLMERARLSGPGVFFLPVSWERPGPFDARLRAIEMNSATSPSRYLSSGEATLTMNGGDALTGARVSLGPVDEGAVDGTVAALPPVFSPSNMSVSTSLRFPGSGLVQLGNGALPETFSVTVPRIEGAEAWLQVRAVALPSVESWHGRRVSVPSSNVAFDVPAPVVVASPAAGAGVDASTVFRWSGGPSGGQAALLFNCVWNRSTGDHRSVDYRVLEVAGTEATLPAIDGVAIDPGATCQWRVVWYPLGQHFQLTQAGAEAPEHQLSSSGSRSATFQ